MFRVWKPNEQNINAKKLKNSPLARGFCCSLSLKCHPSWKYPHTRRIAHEWITVDKDQIADFFFFISALYYLHTCHFVYVWFKNKIINKHKVLLQSNVLLQLISNSCRLFISFFTSSVLLSTLSVTALSNALFFSGYICNDEWLPGKNLYNFDYLFLFLSCSLEYLQWFHPLKSGMVLLWWLCLFVLKTWGRISVNTRCCQCDIFWVYGNRKCMLNVVTAKKNILMTSTRS